MTQGEEKITQGNNDIMIYHVLSHFPDIFSIYDSIIKITHDSTCNFCIISIDMNVD